MNFDQYKFMDDYDKWRNLTFLTDEADDDDVYELRYDLYELDANLAGVWMNFVDSGLKEVDPQVNDKELQTVLKSAKRLRNNVNKNDAVLVDSYIQYLEVMLSMYRNYKRLSQD